MKKILLILPLFLLFCGCADYKELNSIAITTGLSIDLDDGKYKVSVLIANSQKADESNKEGDSGNTVYDGTGKTISEALKRIDTKIPKQLYFGHLAVVVVSKDVAEKGLNNVADFLFRNPETTKRYYLIMSRENDKASDILKILSPLEEFPSQNIKLNIENADKRSAISIGMTYSEFIENYIKKGIEPYLPTLELSGNVEKGSSTKSLDSSDPKAIVSLKGIALFKDSKFISYTTDNESRGINLVNNKIEEMIVSTKCDNNYLVTAISDINTNKKVRFKNGKPVYSISINVQGDIQEVNCDIDLYNKDNLNKITKDVEKKLKKYIKEGIKKAQDNEVDVFGFGNLLYKYNPKYFNKIDDWNKVFKNIDISIKVNVDLKTKGSIKQSIKAVKTHENY
jgi:spore germination protein KC